MTPDNSPWTQPGTRLEREAADALAAIVQSSDDAIYSKDREAIITSWNASAQRLYGYTPDEAIGKPVTILIPSDRSGEEFEILGRVLKGETVEHHETQRVRKDGGLVDVSISVSPVHDREGNIVQAAIISRNITEQKRMQAELESVKASEQSVRRRQALELNDEVVQGLAVAKMAIETGDHEKGLTAVAATLQRAKSIVSRLLEEQREREPIQPGQLVRERPTDPL